MPEPTPATRHQTVDDLIDYLLGIRDLYGPGVPVWLQLEDSDALAPTRVPLVAMDAQADVALSCTLYGPPERVCIHCGCTDAWVLRTAGSAPLARSTGRAQHCTWVSLEPPVCSACAEAAR